MVSDSPRVMVGVEKGDYFKDDQTLWKSTLRSQKGYALAKLGKYAEAEGEFQTAAKGNPNSAALNSDIGTALVFQGQPQLSIEYYERAVAFEPRNALYYQNIGNAYCKFGEYEKAQKYLKDSLRFDPDNEDIKKTLNQIASLN